MPTTALTVASASRRGTPLPLPAGVAGDVTNGNHVSNDGQTILRVKNTGGSPYALTVAYARQIDGQSLAPVSYTLAASADVLIGPFPVDLFGSKLKLNASNVAVTVAAITTAA